MTTAEGAVLKILPHNVTVVEQANKISSEVLGCACLRERFPTDTNCDQYSLGGWGQGDDDHPVRSLRAVLEEPVPDDF